jgi:hydrogenase 3 maturation protease
MPQHEQDWRDTLSNTLRGRVAILCIGNPLRGDDGAGPALAERLHLDEPWRVFDAGPAPENWTGPVCAHRPDGVLAVDAIPFDQPPGSIACWPVADLAAGAPSTHAPSLAMSLRMIEQRTAAATLILGIQPEHIEFGQALSAPVAAAVDALAEHLEQISRRA